MNMFVTFQKFFSSFELLAFDSLRASAVRSLPTGLDLSSGHVVSTCLFEDLARATRCIAAMRRAVDAHNAASSGPRVATVVKIRCFDDVPRTVALAQALEAAGADVQRRVGRDARPGPGHDGAVGHEALDEFHAAQRDVARVDEVHALAEAQRRAEGRQVVAVLLEVRVERRLPRLEQRLRVRERVGARVQLGLLPDGRVEDCLLYTSPSPRD